jgi:hypothetical protein
MDQYVIVFNTSFLYFDLFDLVHLIKKHGEEHLQPYAEHFEDILNMEEERYKDYLKNIK